MNTEERKIFEFRINGEQEWVASKTLLMAIHTYCNIADLNTFDFDESDEVVELPREKWSEYKVTDEYGVVELTFEQWMAVNPGSDIIATTNV